MEPIYIYKFSSSDFALSRSNSIIFQVIQLSRSNIVIKIDRPQSSVSILSPLSILNVLSLLVSNNYISLKENSWEQLGRRPDQPIPGSWPTDHWYPTNWSLKPDQPITGIPDQLITGTWPTDHLCTWLTDQWYLTNQILVPEEPTTEN